MFKSWRENINKAWNRFSAWCKFRKDVLTIVVGVGSIWVVYWITSKQNSLTETSLEVAKQNYIEENRPYVFPGTPTARRSKFNERVAHLPITNYGHTPAYIVSWPISYQRWKPVPDIRADSFSKNSDTIVLAPSSTYTMELPPFERYWSKNDTTCMEFVVGKIWYGDDWNNRLHYTAFAYKMISRYDSNFVIVYQSADKKEKTQAH